MLLPAEDASPADWVVENWGEFGNLVPHGFEACARVFHPAELDGRPVTWAEIADRMQTTVHPRMEFEGITRRSEFDWNAEPGLFERVPEQDAIPGAILGHLARVLRRHTTTPADCVFGFWDGYGDTPPEVRAAPHFRLPGRAYYLFRGAIDDAEGLQFDRLTRRGPALWWPQDRTWFVGSDTDLMTSYVAGTTALVDDILAEPGVETFAVSPDTGVDNRGDDVNPIVA
jgi:hypothetical protein